MSPATDWKDQWAAKFSTMPPPHVQMEAAVLAMAASNNTLTKPHEQPHRLSLWLTEAILAGWHREFQKEQECCDAAPFWWDCSFFAPARFQGICHKVAVVPMPWTGQPPQEWAIVDWADDGGPPHALWASITGHYPSFASALGVAAAWIGAESAREHGQITL